MGSCCFTPTKKDFLWWYWLLLASIVGIPMLLAVLYVARQPTADEELKKHRGKTAGWIFWLGTLVVGFTAFFFVNTALEFIYPGDGTLSADTNYFAGYLYIALQFFFATVAANGANDLIRKRKSVFVRIPLLLLCLGLFLFFMVASTFAYSRPAINVLQFLVCMLPAHYWGRFKDSPDTPRAWKALAAFVASALLFFLVSYFGEDVARAICGQV